MMVLGLRTVIYHVADLKRAKEWYSSAFGVQPYFDEPFYVGFNIGGFELGLDSDTKGVKPGAGGSVAYWASPKSRRRSSNSFARERPSSPPFTTLGKAFELRPSPTRLEIWWVSSRTRTSRRRNTHAVGSLGPTVIAAGG